MTDKMKFPDKNENGFTAIELIVAAALLGTIAYLVLPFIFPKDSKTPAEYLGSDLTQISEILDLRIEKARVNDISVDNIYIGNLGVFSAKAQIRHAITVRPETNEIIYCLRADYNGETRYFESFTGIEVEPTGVMDCPGASLETTTPDDGAVVESGVESDPSTPSPSNTNGN
jgi:prepilin-type N-terminal cleavage/methylation domain-containing protein